MHEGLALSDDTPCGARGVVAVSRITTGGSTAPCMQALCRHAVSWSPPLPRYSLSKLITEPLFSQHAHTHTLTHIAKPPDCGTPGDLLADPLIVIPKSLHFENDLSVTLLKSTLSAANGLHADLDGLEQVRGCR